MTNLVPGTKLVIFNEKVKSKDGNSYCWGWSDRVLYSTVVEEMRDQ